MNLSSLLLMTALSLPIGASAQTIAAAPSSAVAPHQALDVVGFWRAAGPAGWWGKDPAFDRQFRDRYLALHEAAARGECQDWASTPEGALALILLLDQFPRNAFRGTARMYATDLLAIDVADAAIAKGFDMQLEPSLRLFMYLPFGHSEDLAMQERSVLLSRNLGPIDQQHAQGHHDIVKRFGRFPHRNAILGREMRPEEQKFLDEGGFAG